MTFSGEAAVRLAENGKPMARIIIGPGGNSQTEAAAGELATTLVEIVGVPFTVVREGARGSLPQCRDTRPDADSVCVLLREAAVHRVG
jgi:hypothetical protein